MAKKAKDIVYSLLKNKVFYFLIYLKNGFEKVRMDFSIYKVINKKIKY